MYLGKGLWGLVNFAFVASLLTVIYLKLAPDVVERFAAGIGLAFQTGSGLLALWLANVQWHAADQDRQAATVLARGGGEQSDTNVWSVG